ncbi:DUF2779 domain-containing protein [Hyphococcus luteus]|uniref:DUF2779 domain-containing protein n=1 Tax=Hyphococcus luteus TaxID=2058213 RepID=A0A2S7K9P9_9PROT|nr:DUF2779 domain-containing protein [Marinicaulis flavus]PQA89225.1 DUF2779 domain-containing protein [Marinicaulis flavus]
MQLTKTDFIQYLNCPRSLWLLKRDPESYPHGEFSLFLKKLVREGHEVEQWVQRFFEVAGRSSVSFQDVFKSKDGLFARADAIEQADGDTVLYEIKSSTSVKVDSQHNHIKDACFQKICAEQAGQPVDRVCLVHLNGNYVRNGDIDPNELLVFADITDRVLAIEDETAAEIKAALSFLAGDFEGEGCTCLEKSRGNHCDSFALFNPGVPKPSIYSLPRLSQKKRSELVSQGLLSLSDISDDYPLSANQRLVVKAAKENSPQIDSASIKAFLSELTFPLYFFDYETFGSAVPLIDGASPHKQFPVQYSLHVLKEDGTLDHKEYLERQARAPLHLIEQMQSDIGPEGSLLSWHAPFEKSRNKEMAETYPDKADFLNGLNDRMVDLEDVFKTDYVDARFDGSTSIKKVLPVICPKLNYEDLDVQDGSSAMEAWQRMLNADTDEAECIAQSLLLYCARDTLAMVEIYRFLTEI